MIIEAWRKFVQHGLTYIENGNKESSLEGFLRN